jgi:hypothetical protein
MRMNKQEIEKAIYELGKFATGETYDTEYTDLSIFDLAISALEQQLTNGWIPVSERLPEEGRYLVTTVYGEVKESKFDLEKWWQIDNSTISLAWEEEPIKVVAWQPLPEPYRDDICKINDAMFQCRHALSGKINDIGEIILHCELTDNLENVTIGECIGNCESQHN